MMQGAQAGIFQPTPLAPGFMSPAAKAPSPMDTTGFMRTDNPANNPSLMGGATGPTGRMGVGVGVGGDDGQDGKDDDGKRSPSPEMPVRPLSAYNFFFSDERERILKMSQAEAEGKPIKEEDQEEDQEDPEEKKKRLLEQHLNKDRTKRRPHRKTHGKIGFTSLSKLIGKRWRELPEDKKQYYRDIAAMDMDRYQRSVAEYNNERLSKRARR
eukprot:CAMPEP_0116553598 /NCGR_PEP_ID=MMETSP0397-20121206/7137_1 /TAXON_ID=216820 /ORGANISM="Cyclophora tenuis, Strain ECT3854" /LENGTH=211 /DNA_ID=CAMNT_0004078689 /DNA_START=14 /DNA_END=649 /DNA_ORIENTATION=+